MQSAKLQRFGSREIRELNNGTCKLLVFFAVFTQCSCAVSLDNQASNGPSAIAACLSVSLCTVMSRIYNFIELWHAKQTLASTHLVAPL